MVGLGLLSFYAVSYLDEQSKNMENTDNTASVAE